MTSTSSGSTSGGGPFKVPPAPQNKNKRGRKASTSSSSMPPMPDVHFLGPKPPMTDHALEMLVAMVFVRLFREAPSFHTLVLYVHPVPVNPQHQAGPTPGPSNQESFTLGAVPCQTPWEVMTLFLSLTYSHSYNPHHLLALEPLLNQSATISTDSVDLQITATEQSDVDYLNPLTVPNTQAQSNPNDTLENNN